MTGVQTCALPISTYSKKMPQMDLSGYQNMQALAQYYKKRVLDEIERLEHHE